jgi:hypothetical protein
MFRFRYESHRVVSDVTAMCVEMYHAYDQSCRWSRSRSLEFLIVRSFSIDQKWNDWSMIEINQINRFKFLLLYLRLNLSSNNTAINCIIQCGTQRFLHNLSLFISIYFKAKPSSTCLQALHRLRLLTVTVLFVQPIKHL